MRSLAAAGAIALTMLAIPHARVQEGTAVVRGRIVDALTARPLRNRLVYFNWQPKIYRPGIDARPPDRTVRLADDGTFEIASLAAGEYAVGAAGDPGYLDIAYGKRSAGGRRTPLVVAEGARLEITIRAWRAASVSGRVLDERGRPVVGAQVQVVERSHEGSAYASTDDRGVYRAARLAPGEYSAVVQVQLSSYPLSTSPPSRQTFAFNAPVTPYLTDRAGRTMLLTHGAPFPPGAGDGRPTTYVTSFFGAPSEGGEPSFFTLDPGQERTDIDIVLRAERATRIAGRISGPQGSMGGSVLRLEPQGAGPNLSIARSITTSAASDGTFVFVGVPPGSYRLTGMQHRPSEIAIVGGSPSLPMDDVVIRDKEALWADMPVTVGHDDLEGLAVTFAPGTPFGGSIVFDEPQADALQDRQVSLHLTPAGRASRFDDDYLQPERDGTLAARMRPGRYRLGMRTPKGWWVKSVTVNGRDVGEGPIEVGTDPIVDFTVVLSRSGTTVVKGVVMDSDGRPFDDATVVVFPAERAWATPSVSALDISDSLRARIVQAHAGVYQVEGLLPGDYYVAAVDDNLSALTAAMLRRLAERAVHVELRAGTPAVRDLTIRDSREP